jgi:hypothetical protein
MIIFSHFPVFTTAFVVAIIGAALLALIRKWVALHFLTSHHEVAFPIFLQIGVIYAVLLAFTFSMVLNEVGESYTEAKIETTNLLTLAQLAPGFSPEARQMIQQTLMEYTEAVITKEWPKMIIHQEAPEVSKILGSLQKIYLDINVQSPREQVLYANSLEHLAKLRENRRMRIFIAIEPKLENPLILLTMLGLIVVGISYFFGMDHLWAQMVLTGALIFTITAILMVIYMLSNPFSSKFGISPKIFEDTLIRLEQISNE